MLSGLYTDESKAREDLVPVTGACIASLFKSTRKGATDELAEVFAETVMESLKEEILLNGRIEYSIGQMTLETSVLRIM